ncbi:MAG: DUF374 domain-containing protein [Fibrobacter sp.]|nr:DUF374 domain-containing protein [Fibrobacter sp.]
MEKLSLKVRLGARLAALWLRSLRVHVHTPEDFGPGVLGLWHQDLLASTAAFKDRNVHVLVSESGDGAFFARCAQLLGYKVTRGSDTHGATNVRHLLDSMKAGAFTGMALDGPKGPAKNVKAGSLWLSKSSGRPLWLIKPSYGLHITLKTWDNFILPLPLSSIDIQIKYLCDEINPPE